MSIHFCRNCENIYSISIDAKDSNKLTYYCKTCGDINDILTVDGLCVLSTDYSKGDQKIHNIINPYTKLDPTLPRIYNVKCPNVECESNHQNSKYEENESSASTKHVPSEVIYIRYDDKNMKYLYLCVICDTTWKTDDMK